MFFCFFHKLRAELEDPAGDREMSGILSLSDQQHLRSLLEFLVGLAILPSLRPGVGVALAERVSRQARLSTALQLGPNPYGNLLLPLRIFTRALTVPALRDLILEKALLDVCGATLQVAFEPREANQSTDTADLHLLLQDPPMERTSAIEGRVLWRELQTHVPPQPLMEALLMLTGRRGHGTPMWLKTMCYYTLTQCLLTPGCVLAFYAVLLRAALMQEHAQASKVNVVGLWQQCERAALMLASRPCPAAVSSDAYYAAVAPQGIFLSPLLSLIIYSFFLPHFFLFSMCL